MRYYILAVTRDHVEKGKKEGFAQAGHGKKSKLNKLNKGDWIIYYSSKDKLDGGDPIQKFTALGQVTDDAAYQVKMREDFEPWRRNVEYYPTNEADIRPLIEQLEFITNKKHWGVHLMAGFVEITQSDFDLIAEKMHKKRKPLLSGR